MKIVAYTPQGIFNGSETEYTEEGYKDACSFLEKLPSLEYLALGTDRGKIYITKGMIDKSLFVIEK